MISLRGKTSVRVAGDTIWTPFFIQMMVVNALMSFGMFMMNTLFPHYVEQLGASASTVGFVASVLPLAALLTRPVVGPASTSFSLKMLCVISGCVILFGYVFYFISENVSVLVIGRFLQGFGIGFFAPLSMTLVSQALPASKFASGIGFFSLGQALAMAIGPSMGLSVQAHFGYMGVFVLGVILTGSCVTMTLLIKSEQKEPKTRFRISIRNFIAAEALVPTVMIFFLAGAQACIQTFILIYGEISDVGQIGLFFTAYAICLLVSRPVSGKLADRFGMDKVLIPAISLFALAFIVISFSRTLPMFLLSGVLASFGYGICQPLLQTLCMKMVPKERRGVASNTSFMGIDIGFFLLPIIGGWIITLFNSFSDNILMSYSIMFRVMIVPVAFSLIVFFVNRKKMRSFF